MAADVRTPAGTGPQNAQLWNDSSKTAAQPNTTNSINSGSKNSKSRRPNFNEIHAKSLPLDVYPLPAFIPHNPISIVRIAITLLSQSVWRPKSHQVIHKAYFSPETQSIHVTDPESIRALWEQGFWGKGSLSRSDPQWLAQEKRRQGIEASQTSAEYTRSRREERRQFKLERAKAQREAIERQQRNEGILDAETTIDDLVTDGQMAESPKGTLYTPGAGDVVTVSGDNIVQEVSNRLATENLSWGANAGDVSNKADDVKNQEHLQLTLEEAFFLTYILGVLEIYTTDGLHIPSKHILRIYCAYSIFPEPHNAHAQLNNASLLQESIPSNKSDISSILPIAPDNPFLLKYIVYHHFRSLGWVVRPGIKFAVDYLLYLRGPVFHHAEFAIMIIPSYSDPYWSTAEGAVEREIKKRRDWWWLHRMNRVNTQVMKTLMLVYVEIPAPWDIGHASQSFEVHIGGVLKKYKIREFIFKRWNPSRNRD